VYVCVCVRERKTGRVSEHERAGTLPSAHQPGSIKFLFSTGRAALLSNYTDSPITEVF